LILFAIFLDHYPHTMRAPVRYSLRVGSPMQPPVSAAPPRNPWSTDNTSRLISAQPLREPDAAASYAAGISESNPPPIPLKILNP
jgi:hypothetical protein